jgi:hypothetical protein
MEQETRSGAKFRGKFLTECYRDGKLIWVDETQNIITNEGLNAILNIMLHATTQITTWYCTLVESDTTPAAGMTYAVPVYTESVAYDETTRPEYVEAASTAQSTTNSANKAVFTINATKTMYGASLVGGGSAPSTKGNTAGGGTLLCYAKFSASRAVIDDDVINLTYTITSADDGV